MEFWGVEVKSGQPQKVSPGEGMVLHLSQACLGELKKEKSNDSVYLYVNVDGKKLVLGTLKTEKLPQQQFDLVFDKDFEISHNSKSGSVYFYGYLASNPYDDEQPGDIDPFEDSDSDSESDEEEVPVPIEVKPEPKAKEEKKPVAVAKVNAAAKGKAKESDAGKQKVKIVEPVKDDSEDSTDEDFTSQDNSDSQDEDDSDESMESEEETPKKETPKKGETSKKRPAESATKTPVADKKAKVTPQKTDGKKAGGHVATPHPAKQAKTPAANKPQTPKTAGTHTCTPCNKSFTSEQGLESHTKAKHSAGK